MNDNKKIAVNSIIIFVRLVIVSLIGIFASRLVLDALGASDYGLYNVVGGIVTILNVLNTAMVSTTYRYIAFELGKGSEGNPNKVFCTSLMIHAFFAIVIVVLGLTVGEWYISNYLNVDPGKLDDARFVFHFSILATVFTILMVPYHGLLVAYEKFNVQAIIDVVSTLLRYIILYLCIYTLGNRLRLYAVINSSFTLFSSILALSYCLLKFRSVVKLRFVHDRGLIKEMLSFAGWILLGATCSVGKTQGSAMIINFFFGTLVNGAYAVAHQVENFVNMFALSLSKAAIPQITKNFSGGNQSRSIKLTSYISKYTFILMCVASFPVVMEMDFLLGLWLKEVPEGAQLFCKLMIVSILISSLGEGIAALIQAANKQKAFQIVGAIFTLSGLPISILFFKFGFPAHTILVIYCAVMFLYVFVRLYLLKRVLDFDVKTFLKTSYMRIGMMAVPLVVAYVFYDPSSFSTFGHIAGLICSELFLLAVIILVGIDKDERIILRRYIKSLKK